MNDRRFICALILAASAVCIFLEVWSPFFFLTDDNSVFFLPNYTFIWRCVAGDFALPIVNFHQLLGQAFIAQAQNAPLYPPLYLAAGLSELFRGDTLAMIDILACLHLVGGAVLAFLLLRRLKVDRFLSFGAALLWITNPFILMIGRAWIFVVFLAVCLPLVFWLLERFFQKPSFSLVLGLVATKVLLFYQGNVQYIFFLGLFEAAYIFVKLFRHPDWKKILGVYLLPHLSFPFLVAPLLLPIIRGTSLSALRAQSLSWMEKLTGSVNIVELVGAQFFHFSETFFLTGDTRFLFLGLSGIPLLLFLLPSRLRPVWLGTTNIRIYIYLALSALVLSTLLYALIGWCPPFDRFRWPFKLFCFVAFFANVALALICQAIREKYGCGRLLAAILFIFAGVNLLVILRHPEGSFIGVVRQVPQPSPFLAELQYQSQRVVGYGHEFWGADARSLSYNYGTLYEVSHFTGYDPLVSRKAREITADLGWWGDWNSPLNQEKMDLLSSWSVSFVLAKNSPEILGRLKALGLKQARVSGDLVLFVNERASPLAVTAPGVPPPVLELRVNKITLEWPTPLEKSTSLILNLLPCAEIRCVAYDGDQASFLVPWTENRNRIYMEVPNRTKRLVLYFYDQFWIWGWWLFAVGAAYLTLLAFINRTQMIRREKTGRGI